MRTLAHIEKIEWIKPIEGKDRIVLAGILGWQVIVQKADYNVGDICVFCEIDSVLPEKPEFEFLRSKKFRIKTMKMGGVLSQGICFPMSILPQDKKYKIGDDVTEVLGITQYEATMDVEKEGSGTKKKRYPKFLMRWAWFRKLVSRGEKKEKGFPAYLSKTDETRIQNAPFYLEKDIEWIATEKVDGQSGSFVLERKKGRFGEKFEFIVCSRNLRIWTPDNSSYWQAAKKYNMEKVLRELIGDKPWVAIQGECVAPAVQGNKYHVTEADLYVFNVIYPGGRLGSLEAKALVEQQGLKFVPVLGESVSIKGMSVTELLDYATGQSTLYDTLREGIVFRSKDGVHSFKAVSPEFLMKHGE